MSGLVEEIVNKAKEVLGLSEGGPSDSPAGTSDSKEQKKDEAPAKPAPGATVTNPSTAPTSASGSSEAKTGRDGATEQVSVPLPTSSGSATTEDAARPSEAAAGASPAFDPAHVTVIYVLGGPGAGKGTQCAKLVQHKGFVHLSAGDLLRAEQNRDGSEVGQLIKRYIVEGTIVPMEITIGLLKTAMQEAIDKQGKTRFLIDGFPRKMDQGLKFDETVCPGSAVLFLICPEETLLERLLERGKTSGRDDDNAESIKKRFRTFLETSMPVVDYYRKQGKVIDVNSTKSIDEVYEDISAAVDSLQRRKSLSLESRAA